ncbi:MAG: hypothetical protein AAF589_08790, partial [Planctomycetota bacterium]
NLERLNPYSPPGCMDTTTKPDHKHKQRLNWTAVISTVAVAMSTGPALGIVLSQVFQSEFPYVWGWLPGLIGFVSGIGTLAWCVWFRHYGWWIWLSAISIMLPIGALGFVALYLTITLTDRL